MLSWGLGDLCTAQLSGLCDPKQVTLCLCGAVFLKGHFPPSPSNRKGKMNVIINTLAVRCLDASTMRTVEMAIDKETEQN